MELFEVALRTCLSICTPIIISVMVVGVGIALLQALTQIQEMTLTFVPKILAALAAISLSAASMGNQLVSLADITYAKIPSAGYQAIPHALSGSGPKRRQN